MQRVLTLVRILTRKPSAQLPIVTCLVDRCARIDTITEIATRPERRGTAVGSTRQMLNLTLHKIIDSDSVLSSSAWALKLVVRYGAENVTRAKY